MSRNRWPRLAAFCLFAGVLSLSGSALFADPIDPWQGGRAEVKVFDQEQSYQGLAANAGLTGSSPLYFKVGIPGDDRTYHVSMHGGAGAQVRNAAGSLLQAHANYGGLGPAAYIHPYDFSSPTPQLAVAQATWSGDRIHVQPGANGTLPESIRVGVAVTLTDPSAWDASRETYFAPQTATVDVQAGNRHVQIDGWAWGEDRLPGWLLSQGFDSVESLRDPSAPYWRGLQGKVYLDLALDAQGWSDPFDLSLKLKASGFPEGNQYLSVATGLVTLGIDEINLADGTSITDAGYGITFDSGLAWPVPEPASVACWAVVAVAIGAGGRFRRRVQLAGAVG